MHKLIAAFAMAALAPLAPLAAAQAYPSRPIHVIVPFAASSAIDLIGRAAGTKLTEALGQTIVMDNKPGAGGSLGMDLGAKAPPDGYTLVLGALGQLVVTPVLYPKTPYDPVKDFAPISVLAIGPVLIGINPAMPARTLKDLVEMAKKQPGQLNYASSGIGSTNHLAGELFKMAAGVNIQHVPYKGNSEKMTDLFSGDISIIFQGVPQLLPLAEAGKLRVLATTGAHRIAGMPQVPTVAESGYPGAEVELWYGVFAPAATSRDIINRLNGEIVKVMKQPEMRERLNALGVEPMTNTPEQFAALIRDDIAKWAKVIRTAGIKVE